MRVTQVLDHVGGACAGHEGREGTECVVPVPAGE